MDLASLLARPEGKTLELKRDLSSPNGVLRTLVAFANTAGGTLLIGVEDATRAVKGVKDALETEERLTNLITDCIQPRLLPDVEILPWRRTNVVVVEIHPSAARPHFITREGSEAGVYVRVGSTNRRADRDLIAELRRYSRGEVFDEEPVADLDSEALDFRAASESFEGVRTIKRADLETLRLLTRHQGRLVPTIGGVLLFGKDRGRRFPDAWIQAGRFDGKDKARILDQAEIRAPLPQSVDAAIEFVQKHAMHGADIGTVRRRERWTLPPVAVREAVVNAVAHADYSQRGAPIRISIFDDRLEVENPGLLPFGLTVDDLHRGISKLRNRVIGRVFHELRLIEQWGSGVQRIDAACRDAGLEPPDFEEVGPRFRVTLYTTGVRKPRLDQTDQAIVAALAGSQGLLTNELAKEIDLSTRATRTRLARLVQWGLVQEIGTGPQDPRRRYVTARK